MTEQERMHWFEMLNFAKGLRLTRPWYTFTERESFTGKFRFEKLFTEFATHELFPEHQFHVALYKLAKTNPFLAREYQIELEARETQPTLSPERKRQYWTSGTVLGSERTRDAELRDFYEAIKPLAGNQSSEDIYSVSQVKRILGGAR